MDTGEYVGNIHYLFPLIVYLIKIIILRYNLSSSAKKYAYHIYVNFLKVIVKYINCLWSCWLIDWT